jgi:hypothetical protein
MKQEQDFKLYPNPCAGWLYMHECAYGYRIIIILSRRTISNERIRYTDNNTIAESNTE